MSRAVQRSIFAVAAAGCAGLIAGVALTATAGSDTEPSFSRDPGTTVLREQPHERTPQGLTYGNPTVETPRDQMPDLIPVTGAAGKDGYLLVADFLGNSEPAKSPQEAVEQMKKLDPDGDGEIWLPIYSGDGKTVIDKFHSATVTLDDPSAVER